MSDERQARIAAFLAQPGLAAVLAVLNGAGEETRVVGGAVRNLLLGEPASDVDLATTAVPAETVRRAASAGFKAVPTGIEHGTVTLVTRAGTFEVTTLRRDIETDGRRAKVSFGRDFAEDALRRDFTVNALGLASDGTLHDYCGGLEDLAARRIRFIGEAGERIREDYLRILRFFRFHARYGAGAPDPAGYAACIAGRAGLDGLSRERIRSEMLKLLAAPGAVGALTAMLGAGLLVPVLGGVPRLSRFAAVSGGDGEAVHPAFRLAALAVETREDALRLRERLRLSNEESDRVERIAAALEGLSGRDGPLPVSELRRLADRVGADAVAAGLVLLTRDGDASSVQEATAALAATPVFRPKGRDVIGRGVGAGPDVGRVLDRARHDWIEAGCPAGEAEQMRFVDGAISALAGRG